MLGLPVSIPKAKTSPGCSAGGARLFSLLRALRHRNFQLFFWGQLLSLVGTWMQSVALSWLVYRLTGSSFLLGLVGFASQFPIFLAAPLGGMLADRRNRRYLVMGTQVASMILALLLAVLTLRDVVQVWHVFVLSLLLGVVNAVDIPARQSFLIELVGRDDLMNAIALNSTIFNGARTIGPAIAGVLVARLGEGWCFFVNGISYIAVIAGLLMMRLPSSAPALRSAPLAHLTEGVRFAWRTYPIRTLLILVGIVSLVAMPYTILMPLFADRILHSGAKGLGVLMCATGLGAVLGALTLAAKTRVHGLGRWVALSCCGFGASLFLFAFSINFALSVALLIPAGFCMMVQMASCNTLIQAMVPDNLRGRIMALYSMMFMGMAPIGALLGGAVAARIGAPFTVAAGALVAVCSSVLFTAQLPKMRMRAGRLIVTQAKEYRDALEKMTA